MATTDHGIVVPDNDLVPAAIYPIVTELAASVDAILAPILDAWTTYVPTWTAASVNPAIGDGTIVGAYRQVGKTVDFFVKITAGSSTTFGSGQYTISLPVTAAKTEQTFAGVFFDSSASARYAVRAISNLTTSVSTWLDPTTAGNNLRSLNATAPVTLATGDIIVVSGTYEAA